MADPNVYVGFAFELYDLEADRFKCALCDFNRAGFSHLPLMCVRLCQQRREIVAIV
ncbi:unnamed protein product [marine sediment metagenome]|uniref:Uncharacterized protein n=1 Tax=marine sediment metagenome TaxID=412755 RepID=X0Y9J7_9ZZZZ